MRIVGALLACGGRAARLSALALRLRDGDLQGAEGVKDRIIRLRDEGDHGRFDRVS